MNIYGIYILLQSRTLGAMNESYIFIHISVNYGNIIAECLFNPNSILFVDYDRLSHSGT